jgi:hypothetical protein
VLAKLTIGYGKDSTRPIVMLASILVRRPGPAAVVLAIAVAASSASAARVRSSALPRWAPAVSARLVVDLAPPRQNGDITVAAGGHLALLRGGRRLLAFARGSAGYAESAGGEPYFALSTERRSRRSGCSFGSDVVYALALGAPPGVVAVDARGRARRFAALPANTAPRGIAFDVTGRFGGRLLVIGASGSTTSVFAIDCHRGVALLTSTAPRVEGGIAVAPATFAKFAGDLIAPDEYSGHIYAIAPSGAARLVATSDLPRGGDIGVESVGFLPSGFTAGWRALVADRSTPGNPHPGDDTILSLSATALLSQHVRGGELLVAGEGGAQTDAVACARRCTVRHVADGPTAAHVEGHIVFEKR